MKRLLALSLLGLASAAYAAPPTTNLSGKWTITWVKEGSPARIALDDDNGNLSGTYSAEGKGTCSADGVRLGQEVSIHLHCPKSDADINASLANGVVSGTYTDYIATGEPASTAKFRMERSTPALTQASIHQGK